jgi:hypothetical protein
MTKCISNIQRKNVINLIQAVVDEHTSKAENHESGANVLERSEYWKAKTAVTQYKTMLNMFESNMADEVSSPCS